MKQYAFSLLMLSCITSCLVLFISLLYWEHNNISESEHLYLELLKGNIDKNYIFENSLSYVSGHFYLNEGGELQVNNIRSVLCENLARDGYRCVNGKLTTEYSVDPAIKAVELINKAEKILETNLSGQK